MPMSAVKSFTVTVTITFYLPQNTNNNEIKQNSNTKVARKPKRNHGACRYWAKKKKKIKLTVTVRPGSKVKIQ